MKGKHTQQRGNGMATKKPTDKKVETGVDLFAQAMASPPAVKKDSKGKLKKIVTWAKEFEVFTALSIFFKAMEALKDAMAEEYKALAFDLFYKEMMTTGVKPESFDAVSGIGKSAFQCRQKASFYEEVALKLKDAGVPYETEEVRPARITINPEIVENEILRNKMNDALKNIDFGMQVFIRQDPIYKYKPNDATIPAIIEKVKNEGERTLLLKEVTTLAIAQTTLDGQKLSTKDEDEAANQLLVTKALQMLQQNGVVQLATQKKALNKKSRNKSDDE